MPKEQFQASHRNSPFLYATWGEGEFWLKLRIKRRPARSLPLIYPAACFVIWIAAVGVAGYPHKTGVRPAADTGCAIVFVSRQIPPNGTLFWPDPMDMPGVGARSRFRPAAPGRLLVRETDGRLRVLIDGANPTPESLNLIDVNAPDVSYDGAEIVFSGLPAGEYDPRPNTSPGAWRLYAIRTDGTGLRQITFSDQNFTREELRAHFPPDISGFFQAADRFYQGGYDDTDPCWLPDGRIVFSSTRWYAFAQYGNVRASNLFVVGADGSALHRITSERNGADRPLVDPLTGKIVYVRWWRNYRIALDDLSSVPDGRGGYERKEGLTYARDVGVGGNELFRNHWQLAAINPDGTDLALWAGFRRDEDASHTYGGAFTPDGDLYANYFPMHNMVDAAGFGGIRLFQRGAGISVPILGITALSDDYVHKEQPISFGVFNGSYAGEPEVLPDGRLLVSWARDIQQDYGLYVCNADGSNLTLLYDNPGTGELRARAIRVRPLPPVLADQVTEIASLLPPTEEGPYDQDGTFTFQDLNVYFNAPVDSDILSAPAIGSAATIRFFLDSQRSSPGSLPNLDWPILLGEASVLPDGSLSTDAAPANAPLFEQLRSSEGTVPRTGGAYPEGAAHVAGLNFGRPGTIVRCVGCHAGHTLIPVPEDPEQARWTNLAPGAIVTVSSTRDARTNAGLIDRMVKKGPVSAYWTSAPGRTRGEWVQLTFRVPIVARAVRLYNPRQGDEAASTLQVHAATVQLYADSEARRLVAEQTVGDLAVEGTDVSFPDVTAQAVRVRIDDISGTFFGLTLASLAEVEVIARGGPE